MIKKLILGLQKRVALRLFPNGLPCSYFFYFDYFVVFTGAHVRAMIYEQNGKPNFFFRSIDPINTKTQEYTKQLSVGEKAAFFDWLQTRVSKFDRNLLMIRFGPDPIRLRLFAKGIGGLVYSFSINDTKTTSELRRFGCDVLQTLSEMTDIN